MAVPAVEGSVLFCAVCHSEALGTGVDVGSGASLRRDVGSLVLFVVKQYSGKADMVTTCTTDSVIPLD